MRLNSHFLLTHWVCSTCFHGFSPVYYRHCESLDPKFNSVVFTESFSHIDQHFKFFLVVCKRFYGIHIHEMVVNFPCASKLLSSQLLMIRFSGIITLTNNIKGRASLWKCRLSYLTLVKFLLRWGGSLPIFRGISYDIIMNILKLPCIYLSGTMFYDLVNSIHSIIRCFHLDLTSFKNIWSTESR